LKLHNATAFSLPSPLRVGIVGGLATRLGKVLAQGRIVSWGHSCRGIVILVRLQAATARLLGQLGRGNEDIFNWLGLGAFFFLGLVRRGDLFVLDILDCLGFLLGVVNLFSGHLPRLFVRHSSTCSRYRDFAMLGIANSNGADAPLLV